MHFINTLHQSIMEFDDELCDDDFDDEFFEEIES